MITINQSIVGLILEGSPHGEEMLYGELRRRMIRIAVRYFRDDAEDCCHEAIIAVTRQIKRGQLRDPQKLMAYAEVITKWVCFNRIKKRKRESITGQEFAIATKHVADRCDIQREAEVIETQKLQRSALAKALPRLAPITREIMTRRYLQGQGKEQIMSDLGLTNTQYRLRKSRGIAKLQSLVRKG